MGWSLAVIRASLRVVAGNRRLVVFPVVSGAATAVVIVAVALPGWWLSRGPQGRDGLPPVDGVLLVAGYGALSFITVFCNAALVHAANEALRGERPTVAEGFRGAAARLGPIALWALISCTVSVVLRAVRSVRGGPLIAAVLGFTWQLTTYLVVPLLVVEGDPVPQALRRARELLRRTWDADLGGTVGIALYTTVAALLGSGILVACGFATGSETVTLAMFGVAALWSLFVALLGSTVSAVFRTALYRFAADGGEVRYFADLDLSTALS